MVACALVQDRVGRWWSDSAAAAPRGGSERHSQLRGRSGRATATASAGLGGVWLFADPEMTATLSGASFQVYSLGVNLASFHGGPLGKEPPRTGTSGFESRGSTRKASWATLLRIRVLYDCCTLASTSQRWHVLGTVAVDCS